MALARSTPTQHAMFVSMFAPPTRSMIAIDRRADTSVRVEARVGVPPLNGLFAPHAHRRTVQILPPTCDARTQLAIYAGTPVLGILALATKLACCAATINRIRHAPRTRPVPLTIQVRQSPWPRASLHRPVVNATSDLREIARRPSTGTKGGRLRRAVLDDLAVGIRVTGAIPVGKCRAHALAADGLATAMHRPQVEAITDKPHPLTTGPKDIKIARPVKATEVGPRTLRACSSRGSAVGRQAPVRRRQADDELIVGTTEGDPAE